MGNQQWNPATQSYYHSGQWMNTTTPSLGTQPHAYYCVCGEPASNVADKTLFCKDCFFKFSVAKAACKTDEFWAEVEKIQREKQEKFQEEQRKAWETYDARVQPPAQQGQQFYGQGLGNTFGSLGQSAQQEPPAEQPPAKKPWYRRFLERSTES